MAEPLELMTSAKGICFCLREMDSPELGRVFAGALALKRFLGLKGKKLDDLARCIESYVLYERELHAGEDGAWDLVREAIAAQDATDDVVGSDVGLTETAPNTGENSAENSG